MIELILEDRKYLLWGKKIWDVSRSKENELSMNKLKKGELKGNTDHFELLAKIVKEVDNYKGELMSRESIPVKWWYAIVFEMDWININAVYKINELTQ